jgi:hypothetical protein
MSTSVVGKDDGAAIVETVAVVGAACETLTRALRAVTTNKNDIRIQLYISWWSRAKPSLTTIPPLACPFFFVPYRSYRTAHIGWPLAGSKKE